MECVVVKAILHGVVAHGIWKIKSRLLTRPPVRPSRESGFTIEFDNVLLPLGNQRADLFSQKSHRVSRQ